MCTDRTMNKHITEAMKLKAEIVALKAELDKHTDRIKEELAARGVEAYQCNQVTVSYKEISKKRLDQKKLKAELPDIAAAYMVEGTEMRFTMH